MWAGPRRLLLRDKQDILNRKDVVDLHLKLGKLVDDSTLRQAMGLAGNRLLQQQFSSEVMYENTIKVFQSAILEKKRKIS